MEAVDFRTRIFSGVFPTGIMWADRKVEVHGSYKRLAYLNFTTLKLDLEKNCPKKFIEYIKSDAKLIQDRKGEQFQVTTSGQYITLGD